MFISRADAGKQLAQTLAQQGYADKPEVLVIGIPRGGVVVAAEVARGLHAPLDIVVTKKIGAPGNTEYAIGAVNLDGEAIWNEDEVAHFRLTAGQQAQLVSLTLTGAREKDKLLRQERAPLPMTKRTVILVDDGIATGFTTRAAILSIRSRKPATIVLAIPVAPAETLARLGEDVDAVVCLETPDDFSAVGNFYADFPQVEDEQVRAVLTSASNSGRSKNDRPARLESTTGIRRRRK